MKSPGKILIVRTDRIGDVVLTLPLAGVLKKYFPGSKISFLVRSYTKPIVENNPWIDEVITINQNNGKAEIFSNVRKLRNRFDLAVIAYPTFRTSLILFLSGIKVRIGSGYRWYSFLFNKKVYEHRKKSDRHELEYNIRMLRTIGIDESVDPGSVQFNLQTELKSRQIVDTALLSSAIDPSKKIVIIHPGSGGSSVDLPFESMKKLIALMARELDVEILITGSSGEKELCESLVVNRKTKNLAGLFQLPEMISLIDRADIMIANSTGPIHIAAALGKNVIGFYPKIDSCSDTRWGPYTLKKKIFTPGIDCRNCTREQCEKLNCMSSINIEEVFDSVKLFLT